MNLIATSKYAVCTCCGQNRFLLHITSSQHNYKVECNVAMEYECATTTTTKRKREEEEIT